MKKTNNQHTYTFLLRIFICGIFILISTICVGQFTQLDTVPSFDTLTVNDDRDADSTFFVVMNRWGEQLKLVRSETDSTWNYWNHIPALKVDRLYYNGGNTGSPAMSAYWSPNRTIGFDHGIHHLDLYRQRSENMPFFRTDRAYTQLHYNQAPQQTKSGTNIKFGRAINPRSGITILYDRINDLGEFDHQKTRETSVGAGLYYFPEPNKKIFFSYTSNNFTLEENGGITSIDFYENPTYDDRELIPTRINRSLASLKEREARLTANWNLGSGTINQSKGISIIYDGHYNSFIYKYTDPDSLSEVYRQYLVHEDGVRAFVRNNRISNALGLVLDYGKIDSDVAFNGRLSGRLEYQYNDYTQDFATEKINNLILHGGFDQQLSERLRLQAAVKLCLADQAGDYRIDGRIFFQPFEQLEIEGFLISQLRMPTGIMSEFRSLEASIYANDFNAIKYNSIGGRVKFRPWGFSGELKNTIVNDYVYFNDNLVPDQIGATINILQIKLGLARQLGFIYTENYVILQNSSDTRIPLPTYFSKHYLGGRWKLFRKRLQLDIGMDGIILPDFDGYGYFPLTGQFYPTSGLIPYGYTLNGIVGLRVDQFNVFFKFENMHNYWDENPRFTIENHPVYDSRLRIGFRWLLRG